MVDRYPARAWPLRSVDHGPAAGWLRLRTHRLAVSSVAPRRSSIDTPCVLARLGSRRPGHREGYRSTISTESSVRGPCPATDITPYEWPRRIARPVLRCQRRVPERGRELRIHRRCPRGTAGGRRDQRPRVRAAV